MSELCEFKNCENDWEFEDSGTEFINRFCEKHAEIAEKKGYVVIFDEKNQNKKFLILEK